jgi:lysophospholipase L1-like esterase
MRKRKFSLGRRPAAALAATALVIAAAWGAVAHASDPPPDATYYVSIGDSYASGYRPSGGAPGGSSRDGFAYQVEDRLHAGDAHWSLVNFACTGETAAAMVDQPGCQAPARALDGPDYSSEPQAAAAVDFLSAHRGHIGLVTIAIGANDMVGCLKAPDASAAQRCAENAVPTVEQSIDGLLSRIRATVGADVPIVGVSYLNVYAADTINPDPAVQQHGLYAQQLFDNYLNPTLREAYSHYNARFVDTGALAGGDDAAPDEKSWLPDRGTVPAAVGRVCTLTYYCSDGDPHPNRAGHALIADAVEKASAKAPGP